MFISCCGRRLSGFLVYVPAVSKGGMRQCIPDCIFASPLRRSCRSRGSWPSTLRAIVGAIVVHRAGGLSRLYDESYYKHGGARFSALSDLLSSNNRVMPPMPLHPLVTSLCNILTLMSCVCLTRPSRRSAMVCNLGYCRPCVHSSRGSS